MMAVVATPTTTIRSHRGRSVTSRHSPQAQRTTSTSLIRTREIVRLCKSDVREMLFGDFPRLVLWFCRLSAAAVLTNKGDDRFCIVAAAMQPVGLRSSSSRLTPKPEYILGNVHMLTKRDLLRSAAVAVIVAPIVKSAPAEAQNKADWPHLLEAKDIAEEGFIYGLPIVMNYAVMQEYAVDRNSGQFKAPFNEIKNLHHVATPEDTAVITPNSDTPTRCCGWICARNPWLSRCRRSKGTATTRSC